MSRENLRLLPKGQYRSLGEAVLAAGWTITVTTKHLAFVPPEGLTLDGEAVRTVHCPRTPSDHNSFFRVRGKLRRAGLTI